MENQYYDDDNKFLFFSGSGNKFFGIWAINILLTVITLGLYYPWAKTAIRKYMWSETSIEEDRFVYHGTGKELFRGFVIVYSFIAVLFIMVNFNPYFILVFYLMLFLLIPFAIFGAWRYRLSNTSWRGIYFTFDGNMTDFLKLFLKHGFFTIITFGIYVPWLRVAIMKYLFSHSKFGQYRFIFLGDGGELFGINVLGGLFSIFTLYLYTPWFLANRFNFLIENIGIYHDDKKSRLISTLRGGDLFVVFLVNVLIVIFTLGLGIPWAIMRYYRVLIESIEIPSQVDLDILEQNYDDFDDATGEDLLDILDIGLDF